jgi:thiol-disulfide isomerase/thioredoxin
MKLSRQTLFFIISLLFIQFCFAASSKSSSGVIDGVLTPYPAPALTGIDGWVNSKPLSLNELKGNVVLVDFWSYACPHCAKSIPYINAIYRKYADKGLVIIGVHSPQYDDQQDINKVKNAVQKFHITFPVAIDNSFSTWNGYQNHYWPSLYLIDKNGYVVYQHFGEGEYDVLEKNIRFLLSLKTAKRNSVDSMYIGV